MEIIAWVLVALFAAATAYLALRRKEDPYGDALGRLARELDADGEVAPSAPGDPPEVQRVRLALSRGRSASAAEGGGDPGERALADLVRYVQEAVVAPLHRAREQRRFREGLEDAIDALEDLAFYARDREDEAPRAENLSAVIQAVTREYTLETGTPVKFRGPDGALPVSLAPERFKDAFFLLLANAGRFGGGQTVEVIAEAEGDMVRVRVRDRGPGFSREALEHAFEPFWTTDSDALGLGLTHARKVLEAQGGVLRVGNRQEGGGEVVMTLPRSR
jgi:signal transduction histidine kinase